MTIATKKSLLENMFSPIGNYIDHQKKFAEGKRKIALEYAKKATNLHYQNKLANYKQKLERQLQEGDIYDKGLEMAFNGAYFLGKKGWQGTKYVGVKGLDGMKSFLGVGLKPMSRPMNKENENSQQAQEKQRTEIILPKLESEGKRGTLEIIQQYMDKIIEKSYSLSKKGKEKIVGFVKNNYDLEKDKKQLMAIKKGIDAGITSPDYAADLIIKNLKIGKEKVGKIAKFVKDKYDWDKEKKQLNVIEEGMNFIENTSDLIVEGYNLLRKQMEVELLELKLKEERKKVQEQKEIIEINLLEYDWEKEQVKDAIENKIIWDYISSTNHVSEIFKNAGYHIPSKKNQASLSKEYWNARGTVENLEIILKEQGIDGKRMKKPFQEKYHQYMEDVKNICVKGMPEKKTPLYNSLKEGVEKINKIKQETKGQEMTRELKQQYDESMAYLRRICVGRGIIPKKGTRAHDSLKESARKIKIINDVAKEQEIELR